MNVRAIAMKTARDMKIAVSCMSTRIFSATIRTNIPGFADQYSLIVSECQLDDIIEIALILTGFVVIRYEISVKKCENAHVIMCFWVNFQ